LKPILVDSNVLIDIFTQDKVWGTWSRDKLTELSRLVRLVINPVVYSEISVGYNTIEHLDAVLKKLPFVYEDLPKAALFLAAKAFVRYRRKGGTKTAPLPDFFIGAHAAVRQFRIITRDPARIAYYFPTVEIISPERS
jgi:predicted nucleic acid-binding protein